MCYFLNRTRDHVMETSARNLDTIGNVLPKRNNGVMTHCYFLVGSASVLPKCNIGSLIHCYARVRQKPIVPKLHVYRLFLCLNKVYESKLAFSISILIEYFVLYWNPCSMNQTFIYPYFDPVKLSIDFWALLSIYTSFHHRVLISFFRAWKTTPL